MGDRFYGTADLIGWCQDRGWGYRPRLKGNLAVFEGTTRTTTPSLCRLQTLLPERCRTHPPGATDPYRDYS